MVGEPSIEVVGWIELAAFAIELIAVFQLLVAVLVSTSAYTVGMIRREAHRVQSYEHYRQRIGRALLLSLEMLVGADIIRTVALEASIQAVMYLAILVAIRTFLSWSIVLEVEGHWPWQSGSREAS